MERKILIFDLDGVITSERGYFLTSSKVSFDFFKKVSIIDYIGKNDDEYIEMENIYDYMFSKGKFVSIVKSMGVNTNWDLTFIFVCISVLSYKNFFKTSINGINIEKIIDSKLDFHFNPNNALDLLNEVYNRNTDIFTFITKEFEKSFNVTGNTFKRHGQFWNFLYGKFQETYNKKVVFMEKPVADKEKIENILKKLTENGYILAVGTGRPKEEAMVPLENWGLLQYFDMDRFITYTDVEKAQKENKDILNERHLSKPDPYVFLKAIFGNSISDKTIIKGDYPEISLNDAIVVGDAPSDLLATKAIGCRFAGVLTGIDKKASLEFFKKSNADYICDSVLELGDLLL